ncbi:MAG TPA: hypothetical protein VFE50_15865 [Cyclobacteriaceae bacterium]|nr:hypothetical protein [Cyclobacteriaceae bacterium]
MTPRLFIFLLISLFGITRQSTGQSYVGGAGMVNAGYMYTPGLSSSLNSIPATSANFKNGYATIGAEINYRRDKNVIVLSGYIGTQEAQFLHDQYLEPFISKAHVGFGRMVYQSKSISIYPVLAAGAIQSSLIYHRAQDSDPHSVMTSPSMAIGVHFDYLLNHETINESYFNAAMISIRAGYTTGFSSARLQGWTLTVSFGGIAFLKKLSPEKYETHSRSF